MARFGGTLVDDSDTGATPAARPRFGGSPAEVPARPTTSKSWQAPPSSTPPSLTGGLSDLGAAIGAALGKPRVGPESAPGRSVGEYVGDNALGIRQTARTVATGLPGLPVQAANEILQPTVGRGLDAVLRQIFPGVAAKGEELRQTSPIADAVAGRMIQQPDAVRGMQESARITNAEDALETQSPLGAGLQDQFSKLESLPDVLAFLVRNPGFSIQQATAQLPQFLSVVPGSTAGTIAMQAGSAGQQNSAEVYGNLIAKGVDKVEADRIAQTAGAASTAVNAALPNIVPGGRALERLIGGASRGVGARAATTGAVAFGGELASETASEAADQVIQNIGSREPLGKDLAQAAGLGALLGVGSGTVGGIGEATAARSQMQRELANQQGAGGLEIDIVGGTPESAPPAPNDLAAAISSILGQPAPAPAQQSSPAPPAAPAARTPAEAGEIIDRRLAALEEAAASPLSPEQFTELQREADQLQQLLAEQDRLTADGVVGSPETRLSSEERATADNRRIEIRQQLESGRTAQGAAQERDRLQQRLSKIDADADLVALSERLQPVDTSVQPGVQSQQPRFAGTPTGASDVSQPVRDSGAVAFASPVPAAFDLADAVGPANRQQPEAVVGERLRQGGDGSGAGSLQVPRAAGQEESGAGAGAGDRVLQQGAVSADSAPAPAGRRVPAQVPRSNAPATGSSRADLVEAWRAAPTPAAKSEAAAQIAAFDEAARAGEAGADPAARGQGTGGQPASTDAEVRQSRAAPEVEVRGVTPAVRSRVDAVLGPANRAVNLYRTTDQVPADLRRRVGLDLQTNGDVEGFFDPTTGQVHIIESALDTSRMDAPSRAAWVAAHERLGHAGFQGFAASQSDGTSAGASRDMVGILRRASQNETVGRIAQAISTEHGYEALRSTEEAIVEIQAAVRTGDFGEIESRYGVTVPQAQRNTLRGMVSRLVQAIKRALGDTGSFTDADVYQLLDDAWRYARTGRDTRAGRTDEIVASRGTSALLRNLTPTERRKVTDKVAEKVTSILKTLPSKDETAAVAYAGKAKRGWYRQSAEAIEAIFGADAPRFARLLAALSPQISVEGNLRNALGVWQDWIAAGKPEGRDEILDVLRTSLRRTFGNTLQAWENNTVRALSGEETLSGPKVDSFARNLLGDVDEVTNDAWMANWALVNQKIFAGTINLKDAGKGAGYLAMSARVREAAQRLTRLTGDTWTPAEVQETVWSWAKTLTEMADSASEIRNARELVADQAITDDLIAATPDFGSLFNQPEYRQILEESGYGEQLGEVRARRAAAPAAGDGEGSRAGGETAPFDRQTQRRLEDRSAARIDQLRRNRLEAERTNARERDLTEPEADIPFSKRRTVNPYGEDQGFDLEGLPNRVRVGERGVVEFHGYEPAQEIARRFAARHGDTIPRKYMQVDEARAKRIADAYEQMEHAPQDPEVRRAFAAMIDETVEQYQAMLDTGLEVEFITGEDPYTNGPRDAILDVVENNHLWVYPTRSGFGTQEDFDPAGNPLLAETDFEISGQPALANDVFRAVHDYFGHIANGVGFRADGEENAWREHASMYSPLARRAMTSETRGQNSWLNYGPHGEANRTAKTEDTIFADQKTGLMPAWTAEEGRGDIVASRRAQTETPAFKRWFGDSKVVDENGEPLVVYHGSGGSFDVFDNSKAPSKQDKNRVGAMWFSNAPEVAGNFAGGQIGETFGRGTSWEFTTGNAQIYPVYLSMQNPLIDERGDYAKSGGLTRKEIADLEEEGFDGVIWPNSPFDLPDTTGDGPVPGYYRNRFGEAFGNDVDYPNQYAVFRPSQIKSATGNSGAFDPAQDSIIASRGFSSKPVQEDATSVDAYHYSNQADLESLDPTFAGTAGRGAERRRFGVGRFGKQGGTAARMAFYVREDGAPVPSPEPAVRESGGQTLYRVQLDNLYDLRTDPRGLAEEAGQNQDALEEEISDAGFDGFVTGAQSGIDTPVAVVFDIEGEIPVERASAEREQLVASRVTPQQKQAARQTFLGTLATAGFGNGSGTPVASMLSPLQERADAARTLLQDKMLPLLRAQERVAPKSGPGVTNLALPDIENAYRYETLMHGAARDEQVGVEQRYLQPIQRQLKAAGMSVDAFQGWLLARAAPEVNAAVAAIGGRNMADGGSGITTADARAILAGTGNNPYTGKPMSQADLAVAQRLAPLVDGLRNHTLDAMVAAGQITPKMALELRRKYPNFIPMRGSDKAPEWTSDVTGTGRGLSATKANIKRRLGRGAGNLPQDILGEMAGDAQRAIIAKQKAKANQALLRFLLNNPMPDLATVEPVDLEWRFSEATNEAYLGVKNSAEDVERSIIVMHNGEQVRIRFEDEALRDAVMNMGTADVGWLVKYLGGINRWRSAVLTRFNPAFTPINVLRDLQFGTVAIAAEKGAGMAYKAVTGWRRSFAAIYHDNKGRTGDASVPNAQKSMADWVREASEGGMRTGLTQVDDVKDLQRRMQRGAMTMMELAGRAMTKPGLRSTWDVGTEAWIRAAEPILDGIENVNDASENALRLSVYIELRKSGESVERAAEYAKNMTINFNRKGKIGPALNAVFLFYNAAMQGNHAVFRVMRNPKVMTYLVGMAGLQALMAAALMAQDDDDDGVTQWDKIPAHVKRTSLVIPIPGGSSENPAYFALPMPYGFNVFPYMGGRVAQYLEHGKRDTDKSIVADLLKSQIEAFSPVPVDDGYTGLFGDQLSFAMRLAANEDSFGRPIAAENPYQTYDEPRALQGKPDTPRMYQVAAQLLAKAGGADLEKREAPVGYLDIAPEQIEEVVNYVGGGLASLTSKGFRWYEQMDAKNIEGVVPKIAAAPIASRLVGIGKESSAISERYYAERGQLDRRKDVLQDRIQRGEDPREVMDAGQADPYTRGLVADRYKTSGRTDGRRRIRGQVRRTATGGAMVEEREGSVPAAFKASEKTSKEAGAAIRTLRSSDVKIDQAVALGRNYGMTVEQMGLPDSYNGEAQLANRVRQRIIKHIQDDRTERQQSTLQTLQAARED